MATPAALLSAHFSIALAVLHLGMSIPCPGDSYAPFQTQLSPRLLCPPGTLNCSLLRTAVALNPS